MTPNTITVFFLSASASAARRFTRSGMFAPIEMYAAFFSPFGSHVIVSSGTVKMLLTLPR